MLIMSSILGSYLSLTQNGLLQCTSIGDKFSRFEKLLIICSILTFQMSLTNSQNGLLQCTSIEDKFCRLEKLLIMFSILVFYFSLTLKMTHFSELP